MYLVRFQHVVHIMIYVASIIRQRRKSHRGEGLSTDIHTRTELSYQTGSTSLYNPPVTQHFHAKLFPNHVHHSHIEHNLSTRAHSVCNEMPFL
jgi:hypothetical protein